jgi:predicted permease
LQESGHAAATAIRARGRALLVVSEVALGFVLLVGAGLMIRSFVEVLRVDPGFRAEGLLAFEMDLPGSRYPDDAQRVQLVRQVEENLRALPGVESVGSISHLPLDDYPNWYSPYAPEGASEEQKRGLIADHRTATPEYFRAVGAQLVAGRLFTPLDEEAKRAVVVIDERAAQEAWPDEDAVGKKLTCEHITQGRFAQGPAEVIGVIRHIQHHALTRQVRGQIYIPLSQSVRWHTSVAVRASGDPLSLAPAVRSKIRELDKDLAISKLRPMTFYLDRALAATRFTMVLAALFGGLALLLAALGIYGVVAYSANQRMREFGIRMALGAHARDIRRQVLREGLALSLAGLLLGALGALALGRFLQALLFGVTATDLATYLACAVVLPAVALLACWLPARRAARRDPLAILRTE